MEVIQLVKKRSLKDISSFYTHTHTQHTRTHAHTHTHTDAAKKQQHAKSVAEALEKIVGLRQKMSSAQAHIAKLHRQEHILSSRLQAGIALSRALSHSTHTHTHTSHRSIAKLASKQAPLSISAYARAHTHTHTHTHTHRTAPPPRTHTIISEP